MFIHIFKLNLTCTSSPPTQQSKETRTEEYIAQKNRMDGEMEKKKTLSYAVGTKIRYRSVEKYSFDPSPLPEGITSKERPMKTENAEFGFVLPPEFNILSTPSLQLLCSLFRCLGLGALSDGFELVVNESAGYNRNQSDDNDVNDRWQ